MSKQGHMYIGCLKLEKKTRRRNIIEQEVAKKRSSGEYINERAVATLITLNKQRIMPMSVYFPHTDTRDMLIIMSTRRSDPSRSSQNPSNTSKLLLAISTPSWDSELEWNVSVLDLTHSKQRLE